MPIQRQIGGLTWRVIAPCFYKWLTDESVQLIILGPREYYLRVGQELHAEPFETLEQAARWFHSALDTELARVLK